LASWSFLIGLEMRITFVLVLLALSGCSSTTIKLHEVKTSNEIAIITTTCNKSCSNAIKIKIGFDHRYERIDGTILEINGQEGTRKVREGNAFNPSIGTVNIEVQSGKNELVLDHNKRFVVGNPERLSLNLIGGHKYSMQAVKVEYGAMSALDSSFKTYRWFPVVFDLTENKIVYVNPKEINVVKQSPKKSKFYSCISPKEYSEELLKARGCMVYSKIEVTEPAKLIVRIEPKYPKLAVENKITGHLKAELIINEIGGVVNVKIIESMPAGIFDEEGVKVFKKWKYKPAKLNESKVMQKTVITYGFEI
jgi:TonB family protein